MSESLKSLLEQFSITTTLYTEDQLSGAPEHSKTKCLVLKPKAAKTAVDAPAHVLVVAFQDTQVNMSNLAKHIGVKELRMAQEDVVTQVFKVSKEAEETVKPTVKVVLDTQITSCTRQLALSADKEQKVLVSAEQLQKLLEGFKVENVDFSALSGSTAASAPAAPAKKSKAKVTAEKSEEADTAKIGIEAKKDVDFPKWYKQVLTKSEMLEYYDVSGCYIIRPWAYNIWKEITVFFDKEIGELGVENAYFPMFVSSKVLEREKDHIEGFSPEVAWVTRAGNSDLEEPIAIRPTSETVMYPYFAKWIRSHRDLPLRINQWCNVVRWEFNNPQPFLRTREFLWQEGHTAHLHRENAAEEVKQILDLYRQVYEDLLAVPVIKGQKSESEKFAGGLYTTSCEAFIPATGRGVQGATSHCLGTNFAKMFNIVVEDPNHPADSEHPAEKLHVWQNSWGITTRTIGVLVMVHGDDKGLVLPPRVATIQVIVVPCGLTANTTKEERTKIEQGVQSVVDKLKKAGVKVKADLRDNYTPGYKFNHWELRGVPVRLEVGPKDIAKNSVMAVRRDNGERQAIGMSSLEDTISQLLTQIQKDMFNRAKETFDAHIKKVEKWEDVVTTLDQKNILLLPWCNSSECEDHIKKKSASEALEKHKNEVQDEKAPSMGAKSLCIPYEQPSEGVDNKKCVSCGEAAKHWALFGRSY